MKRKIGRTEVSPAFMAGCTLTTRTRLSFARTLAASYLKHHPGDNFYLLVVDGLPDEVDLGPALRLIHPKDLHLAHLNDLCFRSSAEELCAILKPALLTLLLNRYREQRVVYFDADTLVLRRLDELRATLASADIVLAPRQLTPPLDSHRPDEHELMAAGVYDAGLIAVRETDESHGFLRWWLNHLQDRAVTEYSERLYVDYRWLDLVPALFRSAILRDETYNLSGWNAQSRRIERKGGFFYVNARPLATFRVTGLHRAQHQAGDDCHNRFQNKRGTQLEQLEDLYTTLQLQNGLDTSRQSDYGYDRFDNGILIHPLCRTLYAQLDLRRRLAMGDPFQAGGDGSFFAWATRPGSSGLSPFLRAIYDSRPDVQAEFPDVEQLDREAFLNWAYSSGAREFGYDPADMLMPRELSACEVNANAPVESVLKEIPPSANRAQCSIVIPVYNKASLTRTCLDSLFECAAKRCSFEVIVVDDASMDGTPELLSSYRDRVRVVTHRINRGFAESCNAGAAVATGEHLVFLNNDTISKSGWLDALLDYANANPRATIVGSKLLFPNGTIQHAGMVICEDREPRHIYTGFPADHPSVNKSRRFQVVTGGCFLIRRDDFSRASGFDVGFRNGYEDVDLCLRIGESGGEIHYCHASELYHLEAVSRDIKADEHANRALYRARWAHRVRPDEFDYYYEDGLLRLDYRPLYPIGFSLSALVGVSMHSTPDEAVDRVLAARSRQVFDLLKENISLSVRAQEAEPQAFRSSQPARLKTSSPPAKVIATGHIHRLGPHSNHRIVSLILPVKNGGSKLKDLLPALVAQRTKDSIEIVAVDSGSSDDSVDLLHKYDAMVISVDASSFNHGLTRNLGTQYAHGDIFVFLNQSTLPADDTWLANLTAPLDADPTLAAVCGRILPRQDADLLTARDIRRNLNASAERIVTDVSNLPDYGRLGVEALRQYVNFHTLSAAIRADVFRKLPFRAAHFAEDLMWGKEAVEAGLKIQFEPSALAFHSHNYSVLDILRRNFDDAVACRAIVGRTVRAEDIPDAIIRQVLDDWHFLESARLQPAELDDWRLTSAMRRTVQWVGQWLGANYCSEEELARQLSLVEQIKASGGSEPPDIRRARHARAAG